MTSAEQVGVSYVNRVGLPHRQIHFHVDWMMQLVRSIAQRAQSLVLSGVQVKPQSWWIDG
jgi:hypothetical protein